MTEFNCYQKSSFQIKDSAGEQWEKPNMTKNAPRGLKKMVPEHRTVTSVSHTDLTHFTAFHLQKGK